MPGALVIARRIVLGLLSGACWGAIAWALGARAMGPMVMGGVYASPVIGVVVAIAYRDWPRLPLGWRVGLALASLYLAAALFGLAAGIADATRDLPTAQSHRNPGAVVFQGIYGTLWGLTFLGYFVPLWPLAYLNHWALARLAGERHP